MALFNPFQYTSRTFESLLQDINNDPELVDSPNWWKRMISGLGDVMSMLNNALANNILLDTSYTRRNVQLILELIDYFLLPQSTASGVILFYLNGAVGFPVTIQKENLVALTSGSTSVSSKRFEARANATITAVNETFTANAGNDQLTVARVYTTGEKVRFTTTNTLPAPLSISTDYYVIYVDATHIRIAETLALALAGTYLDITTAGLGIHTIHLYSAQITCYQQQAKDPVIIGVSDGVTEWQEFNLGDFDILSDTLQITINSITWTKVTTFVDSISTDTHYRLFYNNDNSSVVQFGNGTYGAIPPAFDIYAEYAVGGGADSNVTAVNRVNIYGGSDSNVTGVMNPAALTGGADPQGIQEAKILGPLLLKARDRFVTTTDGETLALAYGGISQSKVVKNFYGVLSAKVIAIANGGGNPDGATKTALQVYLIDRTVLESVDVRVQDTTITSTNVTSAAKVANGYTWAGQVQDWFRLGWKLFFNEAGQEIYNDYISNGVDSARALINTIFTESYGTSDNTQIQKFLDAWSGSNLSPRLIGEDDIQESDAFAFVATYTTGVNYITIAAPAFPIAIADDEITTDGVLTLTEIP